MKYISPLTKNSNTKVLFTQQPLPIFQNKVFDSMEEAKKMSKLAVKLIQCLDTGFVFNGDFNMDILEYDEKYQNEQSNSAFFQQHLEMVYDLLKSKGLLDGKVLEIGSGKGYFMDLLLARGIDITGIDPTYEGDSELVIKDYYSEKYEYLKADLIILRHTLEHIPQPLDFLQMIARSNNFKGYIYIEIPTFDWIVKNNAVEDIFYEHCNYFEPLTFRPLFEDVEIKYLFDGQYLGIIANLSSIREQINPVEKILDFDLKFEDKIIKYKDLLMKHNNLAIWGAGAKGSSFLNLVDPNMEYVKCVVDINPKKQGKYIGGTGHPIINYIDLDKFNVDTILIMNPNYLSEIEKLTTKKLILI
jgi:hypothetical protein